MSPQVNLRHLRNLRENRLSNVFAALWTDLVAKTNLGSRVSFNVTETGDAVVEFLNMGFSDASCPTNTCSFQIVFSPAATNRVMVFWRGIDTDVFYDLDSFPVAGVRLDINGRSEYWWTQFFDGDSSVVWRFGFGTDPRRADTDYDGLSDSEEVLVYGTDPFVWDSDDDGLPDYDEVVTYGTNPLSADSDGDGMSDAWEVKSGLNPLLDDGGNDPDGDGLTNLAEWQAGTDPLKADTDRDGISDGVELSLGLNPCSHDTDGDGLPDGWEIANNLDPLSDAGTDGAAGDPDNDGLNNADEYRNNTDPRNPDTDGDGVSDGVEVGNGSNPCDGNDNGVPPPVTDFLELPFNIYGDFAAWEMTIQGLGPDDTRLFKLNTDLPGDSRTVRQRLRKGNSYRLSMRWLRSRPDYDYNWYCWQAQIDGQPSDRTYYSYDPARRAGVADIVLGNGWIAENRDGLLTGHVHMRDDQPDRPGGGNVAEGLTATLHILDGLLSADYDRDGYIGENDFNIAARGQRLFRHWINDDDDSGDTNDASGNAPGHSFVMADSRNGTVDGRCDLLDFAPVCIDISRLLPYLSEGNYKFQLVQCDNAVNVVWTSLDAANAGSFLRSTIGGCGLSLEQNVESASVTQIESSGTDIPERFIAHLRSNNGKGVFLVEGRASTSSPLRFICKSEASGEMIFETELPMKIMGVENFYRWGNIRAAAGGAVSRNTTLAQPDNFPDTETNGKHLVFVHGYSVSESEARAWGAEIFKRMWQSGLRAAFTIVTWYGDDSRHWWYLENTPNYYVNVQHAFESANSLKSLVDSLPAPNGRYVAAHSLGNMLVSSAIADVGLNVEQYYMLNAAVPQEAYSAFAITQTSSDSMRHQSWSSYPQRLWANHWHLLFPEGDGRRGLTWRNRFGNIQNAYNYYSSEENVLRNGDGNEQSILSPNFAWYNQENRKGRWPALLPGNNEAGWSFNSVYADVTPEQAALISDDTLRLIPFFGNFDDTTVYGVNGSVVASVPAFRQQVLADAIPAESFAMGANPMPAWGDRRNFNLGANKSNESQWPGNRKWTHSSIVEHAYYFTYKVFQSILTQGGLR